MDKVKVVVLGGSGVATTERAAAIAAIPGRQVAIDLALVGRNAAKLELVAGAARLLAGDDALLTITQTIDVAAALDGAAYVVNQMRVGGLEARVSDESFPRDIGLPGEETVGAGGFANATRTIPVVLDYARQIERSAPQALLISFSNPASLVQYAVARYTKVTTIGLCDSPLVLIDNIARILGMSASDLLIDYVGMHHFGFVTGLWRHGQNLLPQALAKAADICKDIEPSIVQALGVIPSPYFRYVFHADRMLARQLGKSTRAEELMGIEREILADYEQALASGRRPTVQARRGAIWYRIVIAPVLVALIEGRAHPAATPPARFLLNVSNGETLPWLPPAAIIETPSMIACGEVRPLAGQPAPTVVKALVQRNCAYEMAAVEAIVERDRAKALQALLLNPIVHTYDQAAAVLDRTWTA
jgi:6-phospho-beta-glucosidase